MYTKLKLSFRNLFRLRRVAKNWYAVPLYYLHVKKPLIIHFRNGLNFFYIPDAFAVEHFLEEPYKLLNVQNSVVIDVGAYNGDSSIYFSNKGAVKVIAFEPFLYQFKIALDNIKINNVNNILLYNEAIGERDADVFLDSEAKGPCAKIEQTGQTKVHMRSLTSLIKEFKLMNARLKMDCEGQEICLLCMDADAIKVFDEIILEYHREGYLDLYNKLRSLSYDITLLNPDGTVTETPPQTNGLIYAKLSR